MPLSCFTCSDIVFVSTSIFGTAQIDMPFESRMIVPSIQRRTGAAHIDTMFDLGFKKLNYRQQI